EARAQGTVGRPHMAQLLVERGYASHLNDAFNRFLGTKGIAYTPRAKLQAASALELLAEEGATSIVAHPALLKASRDALAAELIRLQKHGLHGIEVHYSEHRPDVARAMASIADRLGLLHSGGSDFHGDVKPEVRMGWGRGDLHVDVSLLEAMERERLARGLWV
ncbi:MAG: phosphatase, partial [Desulfovibrionaceae bacterium]